MAAVAGQRPVDGHRAGRRAAFPVPQPLASPRQPSGDTRSGLAASARRWLLDTLLPLEVMQPVPCAAIDRSARLLQGALDQVRLVPCSLLRPEPRADPSLLGLRVDDNITPAHQAGAADVQGLHGEVVSACGLLSVMQGLTAGLRMTEINHAHGSL